MNGLVAYDSSSSDDGAEEHVQASIVTGVQSKPPESASASGKPGQAVPDGQADLLGNQGPVLGPSVPREDAMNYTEYEEYNDQELTAMSERDLIRHLTQPSHPMTEMPRSPPGSPQAQTVAKFQRFLKLKAKGVHFNEDLAQKSAFKNPALLPTMMQRAGIEGDSQYHNTLPSHIFDVTMLPSFAYKEKLLASQQQIRAELDSHKKAQSASGTRTIDFHAENSSKASSRTSTPLVQHKRKRPNTEPA